MNLISSNIEVSKSEQPVCLKKIQNLIVTNSSALKIESTISFDGLVVEVHISDIKSREKFRHHSYVSLRADNEVIGRGIKGYLIALDLVIKNRAL